MAQVVFVLLGAVTLLGEPAPWLGLVGALLVLAGLAAMTHEREVSGRRFNRTGVWYALAAALSFAVGNLFRKSGMLAWPEAIAGAAIGAMAAAVMTLAVPGAIRRLVDALRDPQGRRGAVWFLGTGLATSLSQFSLYGSMGMSPVWVVNLLAGTEPVFVALLSLVLLRGRERLGLRLWASLGLICAGITLIALR